MAKADITKYKNDFQKEKYDRIIVNVNKGEKDTIELHRIKLGYKSLNNYITDLIRKDMQESKVADSIAIATLGLKEIDDVIVKGAVSPLGKLGSAKKKGIVADTSLQSD